MTPNCAVPSGSARVAELHAVEEIEDLRPELQADSLRDRRVLEHREIEVVMPCDRTSGSVRASIAERERSRESRTPTVLNHRLRRDCAEPSRLALCSRAVRP